MFWKEKYVEHLEEEIRYLRSRVSELENKDVPAPRKAPSVTAADMVQKRPHHKITTKGEEASCLCGWIVRKSDPAELQNEISKHHQENMAAIRAARTSWPQIKNRLESAAEVG